MRPEKCTLKKLFESDRRYVVPLFQRGYVWTLANQWQPLWEDVVAQARQVRNLGDADGKRLRKHFLGAVVLNEDQNRIMHVASTGVIDGQQRLTTIQLLLAAFRDVVAPLGIDRLTRDLRNLTVNDGDWPDPDEAFKVWPTNAGRVDFRTVMMAGSPAAVRRIRSLASARSWCLPVRLWWMPISTSANVLTSM
jgi:hypothetical protein